MSDKHPAEEKRVTESSKIPKRDVRDIIKRLESDPIKFDPFRVPDKPGFKAVFIKDEYGRVPFFMEHYGAEPVRGGLDWEFKSEREKSTIGNYSDSIRIDNKDGTYTVPLYIPNEVYEFIMNKYRNNVYEGRKRIGDKLPSGEGLLPHVIEDQVLAKKKGG